MHTHSLRVVGPLQRGAKPTRTTDILDILLYILRTKDFYPYMLYVFPILYINSSVLCSTVGDAIHLHLGKAVQYLSAPLHQN